MKLTAALITLVLTSVAQEGDARAVLRAPGNSCSIPATLDSGTNVWKNHKLHVDPYYRNEVEKAAGAIEDVELRDKAWRVADVGTFIWLNTDDDIKRLSTVASAVPCDEILGLVLNNLPYKESNSKGVGLDQTTTAEYQSYIDLIAEVIQTSPNTSFAIVVEPRAFPNYFNNTSASDELAKSYRENIPYALKMLNLPNAIAYLDVGNSNSMDWDLKRNLAAKEILNIYKAAGSPSQFRGFATNVANFNSWDLLPGEFVCADDSRYIRPQNEQQFVGILSDALQKNGLPASATHAIMDSSRSGVFGLRYSWDDWCNINGAGFGIQPTAQTGDERLDAFVWVKHPGESDGASDPAESGYDAFCEKDNAVKPSPSLGLWHQEYFEMLVLNADPSL
ncbi:glycoside hydrolase family 6 protein [Daldinia grandis]|nr:glycoside hydrolase family 6 protein [Daldinia grandis]